MAQTEDAVNGRHPAVAGALADTEPEVRMGGAGPARSPAIARWDEPDWSEDIEHGNGLRDELRRGLGALLIAAPMAPVLATILSVLSLATWFHTDLANAGLELWQAAISNLLIAWAILTGFAWLLGLSTAKGALPGTYGDLTQWLEEIRAWLAELNTDVSPLPSLYARSAYRELVWQYSRIRRELAQNGSGWFFGTAYVNVWRRVHQAQEALVRLVSEDALPEAARIELLRYQGAEIFNAEDARNQLQAALTSIEPSEAPAGSQNGRQPGDNGKTDIEHARGVIQVLRTKVDQYSDKQRMGLAGARGDLTRTLTMTAMLSYALFWVVVEARMGYELAQTPLDAPHAAAVRILEMAAGALVLFLWGALVGLFGQLWTKWNANGDNCEDDFGLSISRVVAEPVLAGVAGVCGVVVLMFGGPLLTQGLSGLSSASFTDTTTLQNAFLPGTYPASLLYAAIFALSPSLLISRLQQAGAGMQKNLSGSSSGDGGGKINSK